MNVIQKQCRQTSLPTQAHLQLKGRRILNVIYRSTSFQGLLDFFILVYRLNM